MAGRAHSHITGVDAGHPAMITQPRTAGKYNNNGVTISDKMVFGSQLEMER
jgi:hypothetical protein